MIDTFEDTLKRAKKVVFLTGAGISQESGISTFRGTDSLWKKYDPKKLASAQAFRDNPKLVWSWYNDRRRKIMAAKPNVGHLAIANLQNHSEVSVITQNIDGLPRKKNPKCYSLRNCVFWLSIFSSYFLTRPNGLLSLSGLLGRQFLQGLLLKKEYKRLQEHLILLY